MPIERVSQGFKDISMTFQVNPLNSDLIGLKNENAIARSVRNIVFTLPGEKFDDISAAEIVDEIKQSINNYEPRVKLIEVKAFPNFDNNQFDVRIIYEIIGADVPPQELQFALQSTR